MKPPSPEFLIFILFVGVLAGSAAVWFAICVRWHNESTALPYEPRERVPWNFLGACPAIWLALQAILLAIFQFHDAEEIDPTEFLWQALASAIVMAALVVAAVVFLVAMFRATSRDFGLPSSFRQFLQDVRLGALGWLAAVVPAVLVQVVLQMIYHDPTQHPLVESILKDPQPAMLIAAFLAAVVVAPLLEEFVFRVLLQGWLERLEDRLIGYRATERVPLDLPLTEQELDETPDTKSVSDDSLMQDSEPHSQGILPGMSRGYLPIILSSLLFSLAHLGHGTAPVAIFVLALFLGYLYQRTHRIVPCIVLHMMFNGVQLLYLWLIIQMPPRFIIPD